MIQIVLKFFSEDEVKKMKRTSSRSVLDVLIHLQNARLEVAGAVALNR
jgi:hypothetical protein